MNETIILRMIEPYLKNKSITYSEFDNIFHFLSRKEQYLVTDILFANNIEIRVDEGIELSQDAAIQANDDEMKTDDDFQVLYDDSIFKDDKGFLKKQLDVVYHSNIKQSNEILCSLIQEGSQQSKQDLCVKNEKLVKKYAFAYQKYYGNNLDIEDIEQAGFIGLIKAGERFNIGLGYAFSTYAIYWIRQSIVREIYDHGFAIRIPVHMMEQINKVTKLENKFAIQGMNFKERMKVISDELEISEELIEECLIIRRNYLAYSSLNTPVGEGEDTELESFITDQDETSVEDIVISNMLRLQLEEVLATLTDREQKVLNLRFGLKDGRERTLEEVGKEFNVTRERIRQIEAKAFRKLQHPSRARKLKDYL